jgi:ADP-ribosylglycohydrolase
VTEARKDITMTEEEYREKVMGCWLGKNIGGTLGMPMEWERKPNNVSYYTHDITGEPLPNDDLDIQILWLLALEDCGFPVDAKILGSYFNEFMIFTHAEYGTAKANLRAGLQPPVSGSYNNAFRDSCGSYIRSDIWACIFPGEPEKAASCAFEDAIVDHGGGEGVYAEVFMAALESAAFYIRDIRVLIRIGLSYIPETCAVSKAVRDAVRTYDEGMSEADSRTYIMQHYIGHLEWHAISREDEEKGYADGPMGWDVPSNLMIIIYGLLFGGGDYEKAMCTAVHYGEDTDCTAGTIAALYGIMEGRSVFAEKWVKPVGGKIVTVSIDPFRMGSRIPATLDEMTDRVMKIRARAHAGAGAGNVALCLQGTAADTSPEGCVKDGSAGPADAEDPEDADRFLAAPWFLDLYDDMDCVRYFFEDLHVRLDYCGSPVIEAGKAKKIRFILSDTSHAVTSDRLNVYLYARDGAEIAPQREQSVFLTMAHMGSGISEIYYEISAERPLRPVYRFVAEFIFEDSKNNKVMDVPFVLLSESGRALPVRWEKRGPAATPNLPRI